MTKSTNIISDFAGKADIDAFEGLNVGCPNDEDFDAEGLALLAERYVDEEISYDQAREEHKCIMGHLIPDDEKLKEDLNDLIISEKKDRGLIPSADTDFDFEAS